MKAGIVVETVVDPANFVSLLVIVVGTIAHVVVGTNAIAVEDAVVVVIIFVAVEFIVAA